MIMNLFKRCILASLVAIFALSCGEDAYHPDVVSCFETDYVIYEVGEPVKFYNCSRHADSFLWDFGDGSVAHSPEPVYEYIYPGEYLVVLKAFSGDYVSEFTKRITIVPPTELSIAVFYYGTTDPVRDCEITLFETFQEYDRFLSGQDYYYIAEGLTDEYGELLITGLQPIEYYVDAYKPIAGSGSYYSNEADYFRIPPLIPNELNLFDVYVEYFTYKKNSRKKGAYRIKSIKRREDSFVGDY